MKQLLFILTLLIGTCFATHAKTIKLVPSALDSTRMDTVVISDLQDVDEDQNAAMQTSVRISVTGIAVLLFSVAICRAATPVGALSYWRYCILCSVRSSQ